MPSHKISEWIKKNKNQKKNIMVKLKLTPGPHNDLTMPKGYLCPFLLILNGNTWSGLLDYLASFILGNKKSAIENAGALTRLQYVVLEDIFKPLTTLVQYFGLVIALEFQDDTMWWKANQ